MRIFKRINLKSIGGPKEIIALSISIISFFISTSTLYQTRLRAPDLSFTTAPYIKHVVDNQSGNEAFFIPITITNRGAKPGTLLSFELLVSHQPSGETRTYYAQYRTQLNSHSNIGEFFTPITLYGQSSVSQTICFYPIGQRAGNFFSQEGEYTFRITSQVANVRGHTSLASTSAVTISVSTDMLALMTSQPDGEYPYPLAVTHAQ